MNYKVLLLNAYTEHCKQRTSYKSFFKREAQIAKRDNFVEFSDFFDGCQHVLESYKNEIIRQYNERLTEKDSIVETIKLFKGPDFENKIVTDQSEKNIQDDLHEIAEEKELIKELGYINNDNYRCYLTEIGEITKDIFDYNFDRCLYWNDIIKIEQGVLQAKAELLKINNNSKSTLTFYELLNVEDKTKVSSIIELIKRDLKISKNKNLTIALITTALVKKGYLNLTISLTQYHKCLVDLLGKEIGQRNNFNEKYNDINKYNLYQEELNEYLKFLPENIRKIEKNFLTK